MLREHTLHKGLSGTTPRVALPLPDIRELVLATRGFVACFVNATPTVHNWIIGDLVYRDILKETRADYGERIVQALSAQFAEEFDHKFSRRNLFTIPRFGELFPDRKIVSSLMTQLSWSICKLTLGCMAPLLATCVALGDDWPQFRGSNRDGTWNETGLLKTFSK